MIGVSDESPFIFLAFVVEVKHAPGLTKIIQQLSPCPGFEIFGYVPVVADFGSAPAKPENTDHPGGKAFRTLYG
jgi:hypothetical protein